MDDRRRLDDDLDPLVRQPEEEVRLDQLEALVRERRRVDRDLRAHAPGRVRERLLGRDVLELLARAPAERAAGARSARASRTCSGARPSRHWNAAECSLSTGSSRPPPRSRAASASSPAATRLSLFASASVDAVLERPERRRQARRSRRRRSGRRPARRARAARSGRRRPASAARARRSAASPRRRRTSSSSGWRATISSAWRPIEPVAPRRAIRFICSKCTTAVRRSDYVQARGSCSRPRPRRRGARRAGRASRRGRRAGGRCPSPPRSRLTADSNRSPSGAATAITAPSTSDCQTSRKSEW